jgi:hypothetical protein
MDSVSNDGIKKGEWKKRNLNRSLLYWFRWKQWCVGKSCHTDNGKKWSICTSGIVADRLKVKFVREKRC